MQRKAPRSTTSSRTVTRLAFVSKRALIGSLNSDISENNCEQEYELVDRRPDSHVAAATILELVVVGETPPQSNYQVLGEAAPSSWSVGHKYFSWNQTKANNELGDEQIKVLMD